MIVFGFEAGFDRRKLVDEDVAAVWYSDTGGKASLELKEVHFSFGIDLELVLFPVGVLDGFGAYQQLVFATVFFAAPNLEAQREVVTDVGL